MRWRLVFLLAMLLPEAPLDPFRAELGCSWAHLLGTDPLGRDALLRLGLAGARSLGFASAVALLALALGLLLGLGRAAWPGARSALRAVPPLLLLVPLAALVNGLGWIALGVSMALLLALQLEPPLRARLEPFTLGPAWAMDRVLGAGFLHRCRQWAPWAYAQARPLFPGAWIGALWGEATLRLLGLGPGPQHDSFGLLLNQELPRLSSDPTPLGWAALTLLLALALLSASKSLSEE